MKQVKYETYVEYRDKLGETDYSISGKTSIPKSTFSEWMRGRYTPKTEKQLKIAKVLKIPNSKVLEPDDTRDERRQQYDDGDHD